LRALLPTFLVMAVLAGADLLGDFGSGTNLGHLMAEGGILLLGLAGAAFVGRRLLALVWQARAAAARADALASALEASRAEAERWRGEARELLAGLSHAIDDQFERWQLTPAEKEVALLLLKGLSHKEIADTRSVTEATARQQARAVYKKARLSGRHDLAAFFLEDLMLPRPDAAGRP
jgi:DNA-binding CsgD family transcriptional regulator